MTIIPLNKKLNDKIISYIGGSQIASINWVETHWPQDGNAPSGLCIEYTNGYKLYIKGGGCSGNDCNSISLYNVEGKLLGYDNHEF